MYGLRDEASIARELARSPESVRRMAEAQFRSTARSGPWTVQEVQELKRFLGASTPQVIARILGRSQVEVQQKIFELGRIQQPGRWTREETVRFKKIYGSRSDEDLAVIFGRSLDAVRRLAARCCLAKDKAFVRKLAGRGATRMPRWSNEELELLRQLYPSVSNLEIAQRLNRSVKSVVSKAHHIGLHKDAERLRTMGRENVSLRYEPKP
ncbi:MAG TPA: hypothetical protein VMS76_19110 [Planctomycetota bacterium]|nr:hypothetical protein [Planctomycetota bacterium]